MWKKTAKSLIQRLKRPVLFELEKTARDTQYLLGEAASQSVRRQEQMSELSAAGFRVFSQWDEDGMLDWLIERLEVPFPTFVEFGVESYRESNTRFLLMRRNWRGLILDGSNDHIHAIVVDEIASRYDLTAVQCFVTRDNINDLIGTKFSGDIGLLAIDIDGNDYWVLEKIKVVSPVIIICEYNAVFGDLEPLSIPYDPTFLRTRAHPSNLYFGASLPAFRAALGAKGYEFVGTNLAGGNAFFVRSDFAPRLQGKLLSFPQYPSRARESRDSRGRFTYVSDLGRIRPIAHLLVVRVDRGETVPLGSIPSLYSPEWLRSMSAGAPAGPPR